MATAALNQQLLAAMPSGRIPLAEVTRVWPWRPDLILSLQYQ